jgi:hypothetical protein
MENPSKQNHDIVYPKLDCHFFKILKSHTFKMQFLVALYSKVTLRFKNDAIMMNKMKKFAFGFPIELRIARIAAPKTILSLNTNVKIFRTCIKQKLFRQICDK